MSVLKSKRTESSSDFVKIFLQLYDYTVMKCNSVAKRKQRWICEPIISIINKTYDDVLSIHNQYYLYELDSKLNINKDLAKSSVTNLLQMQKHLYSFWNIENYDTESMIKWCFHIDNSINKLMKIYDREKEYKKTNMHIIDKKYVVSTQFVSNMCKLHRYIYKKVINSPSYSRDSRGKLLMELADDALYHVIEGNIIFPKSKKEYLKRYEHFSKAEDCIRKMSKPTVAVFNLIGYSESIQYEWSKLVNDEENLLKKIISSDKKRFGDLD